MLRDPTRLLQEHQKLQEYFNTITTSPLLQDAMVQHVNIVLMGRMGNGKSSYLNTIKACLGGEYVDLSPVGVSAAGTFTKSIGCHFLNNTESIRMWDTWGWDGHNWTVCLLCAPFSLLTFLVAGCRAGVPAGWSHYGRLQDAPACRGPALCAASRGSGATHAITPGPVFEAPRPRARRLAA